MVKDFRDNDRPQFFKYFYSREQDQEANEFKRKTGWHKIWASESQGMNGDTWILYRSIPDLPKHLQDYARGQEKIEEMVDQQGCRAFPGDPAFEPEL